MKKSVIDIGSNSLLLLIGESNNGIFTITENELRITGLGLRLDETKVFATESMERTMEVLAEFATIITGHGLSPAATLIVATEASRVSLNALAFYERVKQELGFSVNIINASGESYYSVRGVCAGMKKRTSGTGALMDLGGASTEFVLFSSDPFQVIDHISLPIGCVRCQQDFDQGTIAEKVKEEAKKVRAHFSKYSDFPQVFQETLAIAGTLTSICGMIEKISFYQDELVHDKIITIEQLKTLLDSIKNQTAAELLKNFPFLGKRTSSIKTGLALVTYLAQELDIPCFRISVFGARYGILDEGAIKNEFIIKKF